jgi:hypothetical protein
MDSDSDGRNCEPRSCGQQVCYAIRLEGHLKPCWSEWFEGMAITHPSDGETLRCGPVQDQAALHGVLARVRDMNLKLLSVQRL